MSNLPKPLRFTDAELVELGRRILAQTSVSEDGCWEWLGRTKGRGYGRITINSKEAPVHRIAYRLWCGPLDTELVCHACDNPRCINPKHLWTGTTADNIADRDRKNRGPKGEKNGQSKLTEKAVEEIKQMAGIGLSSYKIAPMFGVHPATIQRVLSGARWKS